MSEVRQEQPDDELIRLWQGGDERAAAGLVKRHARGLARYLSGAGGGDDVEDLVQETFFRAFHRIDDYRGAASFRTWLFAIGGNVLKDQRRREGRRPVVALDDREVVDEGLDPHGVTVERDMEVRLQGAVMALPEMQRSVFLLRAQQGLDYGEIAAALDTSVGAARVHYHHAVKRLKEALE